MTDPLDVTPMNRGWPGKRCAVRLLPPIVLRRQRGACGRVVWLRGMMIIKKSNLRGNPCKFFFIMFIKHASATEQALRELGCIGGKNPKTWESCEEARVSIVVSVSNPSSPCLITPFFCDATQDGDKLLELVELSAVDGRKVKYQLKQHMGFDWADWRGDPLKAGDGGYTDDWHRVELVSTCAFTLLFV